MNRSAYAFMFNEYGAETLDWATLTEKQKDGYYFEFIMHYLPQGFLEQLGSPLQLIIGAIAGILLAGLLAPLKALLIAMDIGSMAFEAYQGILLVIEATEKRKNAGSMRELKESAKIMASGVSKLTMQVVNAILSFASSRKSGSAPDAHSTTTQTGGKNPRTILTDAGYTSEKVLETLTPEQLSGLSQLPSNDPIYPLLDTMKNGRINGVSVDEYIAIRQRANQGVGNVDTTFTQSKQIIKPGTSEHKTLRWESYKDAGGEWDYERWSKTYENNMLRATKANEAVDQYHEAIKWGNREVTVDILLDNSSVTRRLDIADIDLQQGIEYKTGYTYASEYIVWEVTRDSELVRNGWDITWVIEGRISTPLENLLLKNHIKVIKR